MEKRFTKPETFKKQIVKEAIKKFWQQVALDVKGASHEGLSSVDQDRFEEACMDAFDAWIEEQADRKEDEIRAKRVAAGKSPYPEDDEEDE